MNSGQSGMVLSKPLSLDYKPVTRVENFCATGSESFRNACYAVAAGAYDVVMATGVEKLKDSGYSGLVRSNAPGDGTAPEMSLTAPAAFSLLDPAYTNKYDVDPERMREAMTDGAAAALIVRAEDAHRYTDRPMYVKALSMVAGPGTGVIDPDYDYTTFPEVVRSAEDAYAQAQIDDPREELSLAEVHDCFTPTELVLMEDMGLSERGAVVEDELAGSFDLDGKVAVNPDGGLKSFGHPVGASGLRMLFENWLQFRGEAGERQLDDAKLGMTHNLGGRPGTCVSFISIVGREQG
jgi:acetyl-CoA C-acetyltransferase